MPKLLYARQPRDEAEHRLVRKLATSRHAPADWVWHAKMIVRSPVRRILLAEGVRWRRTRLWATSTDPEFAPTGRGSSPAPLLRRRERRSSVSTNWVP